MFPSPRHAALAKMLAELDDQESEGLKQHSPKFAAVTVEDKSPDKNPDENPDDIAALLKDLPPEVLAKLLAKSDGDDMAPGETPADDMKAEKFSEGGLIEGDSLADEQMKRREEVRKAEQDRDAANDAAQLAADAGEDSKKDEKIAKLAHGGKVMGDSKCANCGRMKSECVCGNYADGGLIEGDALADEQMKRRETARRADEDANASNDMADLADGRRRVRGGFRKSPYYGK